MLITELKAKEAILSLVSGKVFIVNCHGCKEIHFPEAEAEAFQKELIAGGNVTGVITTDYICNPENLKLRLQKHAAAIEAAGVTAETAPEDACEMLISVFPGLEVTGVTGAMRWDATGEVDKTPMAVVIENGVYVSAK